MATVWSTFRSPSFVGQSVAVDEVQQRLVELGGGDRFGDLLERAQQHQRQHGCGLFPAGPAVMQLTATFVRAAGARTILDLGCGIGYSTFWLADAGGAGSTTVGVDSDPTHIELARSACTELGLEGRVEFVLGDVADVLGTVAGPVDAIHDDAWFAAAPSHLDAMVALLAPGGLLTMPNWFLLVDALTGQPRNDWEHVAGPSWAEDAVAYAGVLSGRRDLAVSWIIRPPLGVAVKLAAAEPATGPSNRTLEPLTREECWRHLAELSIGRLAVITDEGLPFVVPVNYTVDGESVVFASDFGTKFASLLRHPVAFQADSIDVPRRLGWSVLVQGVVHEMEPQEAAHLTVEPWVGPRQHFLRVVPRHVSGRRVLPLTDGEPCQD
jgi:predicted O-methyltransferase YrrM/nitroimidazol reductase NimA-like FMN-containing flavoprotein (pyridoxamine 5'-phosphate oxidase superfamily)